MMTSCDQAIELLPWLMNGTLEAGERRQVLQHLASCARCREALADTRTAWAIFDWHPAAAELIAYAAEGEGGAAGAGGVEEHLAACPACAAELELVRASRLLSDPAADERIALLPPRQPREEDAAARRAWRRSALAASVVGVLALSGWLESARHARTLEERLAARPAPPPPAAVTAAPTPPAAVSPGRGAGDAELRRRAGEAQAKLDALARENQQLQRKVADLGRSASELERRTAGLAAPAPRIESDAWLNELTPAEQRERGAAASSPPVIPLSSGTASLLLRTRHRDTYPDYEIEIHDAQDRLVGSPTEVHRLPASQDPFEEFGITLRRGALPRGVYTILLFGRSARPETHEKAREPLETYPIRIS
jgi:anti-sigma factor RsiW